jgi:hypothetical protein
MKNTLAFVLTAASLLLASGAQAQTLHVRANVPFDFSANGQAYSSGSVEIQTSLPNSDVVTVIGGGDESRMLVPLRCSSIEASKKTVLVFHRVGDEYFLYQIWTAGSSVGREFPTPKREIELAKNGNRQQTIIVAANTEKM